MKIAGNGRRAAWLGAGLCLMPVVALPAAETLVWRAHENRVDAQIEHWDLAKLLGRISAATGWQVYVQPGTERTVSVKFEHLDQADALRLLLGRLSFALVPEDHAPPKLLVYRTSVQDAVQLVPSLRPQKRTAGSRPIPNQLIVRLKKGAKESIDALARRLGAKVIGKAAGLDAYLLRFADAAAAQTARETIGQDNAVAGVDTNYAIDQPGPVQPLAMSSAAPFGLRPNPAADGGGVVIGLIDTAVQTQAGDLGGFMLSAIAEAGGSAPPSDAPSHGTAMAETILHGVAQAGANGGATSVRILPVDVYGNNAETTTFDVANGIYSAIQGGATLINLSMGGADDSPFLHQVIQTASQQGVLFFAAAGNEPTTAPTYPAAYPEVISVTAGGENGLASYANRGAFVDVVAPGASVVSFNGEQYLVMGTSASTADVTGLAAGLSDGSGKTPAQVRAEILSRLSIAPLRQP
jgi:Subtilase family/Fervidolysin N-terminal prodomain